MSDIDKQLEEFFAKAAQAQEEIHVGSSPAEGAEIDRLRSIRDSQDSMIASLMEENHRLRTETADQRKQLVSAASFVRWALHEGPFDGCDLDGASVQDKAEELGLIIKVPYDPKRHGENPWCPEVGDDWFELSPGISSLTDEEQGDQK